MTCRHEKGELFWLLPRRCPLAATRPTVRKLMAVEVEKKVDSDSMRADQGGADRRPTQQSGDAMWEAPEQR